MVNNSVKSNLKRSNTLIKYWKEHPEEKKRLSEYWKNKPKSEKTKIKMSEGQMGHVVLKETTEKWKNTFFQNHTFEERSLRAKKARSKCILPFKNTSIEVKIQNFLKQLNIEFYTHQYMHIEHFYRCDIFIPIQNKVNQNTIIECYGDYWHGNILKYPKLNQMQIEQIEEDKIRTKELIEKGYRVIRLWENEIKVMNLNNFELCVKGGKER